MAEIELRATSDLTPIAEWYDNLFFQVVDQRETLLRDQDKRMLFADFLELLQERVGGSTANEGSVVYVSPTGSTTGERGNSNKPFATIAQAQAVFVDGDIIISQPGTYTNQAQLGIVGKTARYYFPLGADVTFSGNVTNQASGSLWVRGAGKLSGTGLLFNTSGGTIDMEFDEMALTDWGIVGASRMRFKGRKATVSGAWAFQSVTSGYFEVSDFGGPTAIFHKNNTKIDIFNSNIVTTAAFTPYADSAPYSLFQVYRFSNCYINSLYVGTTTASGTSNSFYGRLHFENTHIDSIEDGMRFLKSEPGSEYWFDGVRISSGSGFHSMVTPAPANGQYTAINIRILGGGLVIDKDVLTDAARPITNLQPGTYPVRKDYTGSAAVPSRQSGILVSDEPGTGGGGGSTAWADITGKPSTFTPSAHTHTASQITDFTESVQDVVAAFLGNGSNVNITSAYDDATNSLVLTVTGGGGSSDPEAIRDAIGAALVGVGNVSVLVNDAGDTITISTTALNQSQVDARVAEGITGKADTTLQTAVAWVQATTGNDSTGTLGREDKPYKTIDAALDALPSTGGRLNLSLGTHDPITPSKIKNNTVFEGSGVPGYNSTITVNGSNVFSFGTPTALVGGTIIRGGVNWSDKSGIQVRNLGCDNGSAYVAGGGTEGNGVGAGSANGTAPFTLMTGTVIENVVTLGSAPGSLFHGIVLENHVDPIVRNVITWYSTHGVALKVIGGKVSNVITRDHTNDGLIIKSDTYAYSKETSVSGFRITSSDQTHGGVIFQDNASGLSQIRLSDVIISNAAFGIKQVGTFIDRAQIEGIQMNNVLGKGIEFTDLRNSRISFCEINSAGVGISVAGKATRINNCSAPSYAVSGSSPQLPLILTNNFATGSYTYQGSYVYGSNNYGSSSTGSISAISDVSGSGGGSSDGDISVGSDLTFANRDANVTNTGKVFVSSGNSGTTFTDNALESTLTLAANAAGRIFMHCPASFGPTQTSGFFGFLRTNDRPTGPFTFYAAIQFTAGGQVSVVYDGTYNSNGSVATPYFYKSNYWYGIYRTAGGIYSLQESGDGANWQDVYTFPTLSISSTEKLYVGMSLYTDGAANNKIYFPKANGLT